MTYPTTEDFKKNVRQAFNAAETGEIVYIMRYGKKYQLIKVE